MDPMESARYMAEISNRMQVPDRIMVSGDEQGGAAAAPSPSRAAGEGKYNDLGMRQRDPRIDMQVPDRIMVAGGDAHVQAKATPRELQLDAAVLPPTLEHVRVSTPPRSIKLGELAFPSATDDEGSMASSTSTPTFGKVIPNRAMRPPIPGSHSTDHSSEPRDSASLALLSDGGGVGGGGGAGHAGAGGRENMTVHEELQLIRRQMAKINHRLMAVELENQQQQQREMILTVLVAGYFIGKTVLWLNKSL